MVTRGGGVAGWGGGARVWPLEPLAPAAAKVTVGCSRRTCRESHRRRWQFWHCLVVHRLPAVGLCDAAGCNGAPGRWASGSAAGGFAFAFRAELVLLVWAADVPSAGDQFILRTHSPIRHGHAVGRERGGASCRIAGSSLGTTCPGQAVTFGGEELLQFGAGEPTGRFLGDVPRTIPCAVLCFV